MASSNLKDRAFASICRGLGLQFEEGEFCDICVVVGPREFSCHRVVLASVSTYFKTAMSMWECFPLAEQREKAMHANNEKRAEDTDSANATKSTVIFKEVGKFTARRHFGAYLQSGEITVCGGERDEKKLLYSFEGISLANGETEKKKMTLISGAAQFDLHFVNVPAAFFREDIAEQQPFRVGDTVTLHPNELYRLQNQNASNYYRVQIPYGTGNVTAVGNQITVQFPSVGGWNGTPNQLQHAA